MKIISVHVGRPRIVDWNGRSVQTSIWKDSVSGPVRVSRLNLDGDQQSDLSVHGGVNKAVYAYPSEHYVYWRKVLKGDVTGLFWGVFGENLTTEGLLEDQVRPGDHVRIGTAEFVVTQPRQPCFKLGIRFNNMEMIKQFMKSKRTGFYFSVFREGKLEAGDPIEWVKKITEGPTIADVANRYAADV